MTSRGTLYRKRLGVACFLLVVLATLLAPATAWADGDGSIDHAEARTDSLRLLYSVPGLPDGVDPDLDTLRVTINGEPVEAHAEVAAEATATETVRRTTIMAIDVSNSMRGERFTEAKLAAKAFLDGAPADLFIGIVAFAGDVRTIQEPSLDRTASASLLDELTLSRGTRLYDGVGEAISAGSGEGQRSLLVLSDGKDTSRTPLSGLTGAIEDAEIKVDVVSLEQSPDARQPLEAMARAGQGAVLSAEDPQALTRLFSDEAQALAKQVLISAVVPADVAGREGTVAVSVSAAGEMYTDTAFVSLVKGDAGKPPDLTAPTPALASGIQISPELLLAGLVAGGVGVLVVLLSVFGVFERRQKTTIEDRIAAYTRGGRSARASGAGMQPTGHPGSPKSVTESAVGLAEKALAGNKGFESSLGARLEAAGLSMKPAEWLLLHAGVAVGAALTGFLISSGRVIVTLILLFAGAVIPWLYLSRKKTKRLKAFNNHLAETLQLVSGSLSAGLSLAQSIDTVVREGVEPIAGEFRRALVEARLGVEMEEALDSVATRMESEDFEWVVMAIRIQREVGGNLAELLLSVAATMRERAYLRRQVRTLSAEGRMSAWILGGLPPFFILYLAVSNPTYLDPLFSTPLGWLMIGVMVVLMAVGSFWMSRVVKVEV